MGQVADYVIGLLEEILDEAGDREKRFAWAVGDVSPKTGRGAPLPFDAFWASRGLLVEVDEDQHRKPVPFWDKPDVLTVSGMSRGEQRAVRRAQARGGAAGGLQAGDGSLGATTPSGSPRPSGGSSADRAPVDRGRSPLMGDGCSVTCPQCGYHATLEWGSGTAGVGVDAMHCLDCDELVSVVTENAFDAPGVELGRCPDCSGQRLEGVPGVYDIDEGSQPSPLPCPKCRALLLVSRQFIWD